MHENRSQGGVELDFKLRISKCLFISKDFHLLIVNISNIFCLSWKRFENPQNFAAAQFSYLFNDIFPFQ